jgi:hypothetical protein
MAVTFVTLIRELAEVDSLAEGLLNPRRDRPWAIVSIPFGVDVPLLNLDVLERGLGELCPLFVLPTGDLSWRLSSLLPERCQVYGGAARVYPVGTEWTTEPTLSPLRFIRGQMGGDRVADALIADALGMANAAGLLGVSTRTQLASAATVTLIVGAERAVLELDEGGTAVIAQESVCPGVPLDWVMKVGQHLTGTLDPDSRWFAPDWMPLTVENVYQHFPIGTVTLGLVCAVQRQAARIQLHPSLSVDVSRADVSSNRFDRVDLLLAPGDVVSVRVVRDANGRLRLNLGDIDDDEPVVPAMALVRGGDPWLLADRSVVQDAEFDDVASPVEPDSEPHVPPQVPEVIERHPSPGPGLRKVTERKAESRDKATALKSTQLALATAQARVKELESAAIVQHQSPGGISRLEFGELQARNARLRDELAEALKTAREQRQQLRTALKVRPGSPYELRRSRFDSSEEWIRHEILLAWIDWFDAGTRRNWPLPESYRVGEAFAESVSALDDAQLSKTFKAVVDVLTGHFREAAAARRPHPLRVGSGAEDQEVVRQADAARCMRVSIESNVASARRLHYWNLSNGEAELSRVVLHDDMTP